MPIHRRSAERRKGLYNCLTAGAGAKPVGCGDSRCGLCVDSPIPASCCGDGDCTSGAEGSNTCAVDCGPPPVCGDGVCHADENGCDCPADCPKPAEIFGNGIDDNCDGATDCADAQCLFYAGCSCMPNGLLCTYNSDCCSGKCAGGSIVKTCR